jgi:hypothetical protein
MSHLNLQLNLLKDHILNSGYQTPQQTHRPYIQTKRCDKDIENDQNKYVKLASTSKYKTSQTYNC